MKIKFLSLMVAAVLCVSALAGCSVTKPESSDGGDSSETQSSNSVGKKKYADITADSVPVGVDEIKFSNEENYTMLTTRIYKNGGDIEESYITVTFELYDENEDYICRKAISTNNELSVGEEERCRDDILWEANEKYSKNVPNETLAQYTAKIVNIEEKDAKEVKENQEITQLTYDIDYELDKQNYNRAKILLDDALSKYPDNTELKLLQADLEDALAKNAQGGN